MKITNLPVSLSRSLRSLSIFTCCHKQTELIDDNFNTKSNSGEAFKTKLENKDFLTMTMNYNLSWAKFKLQLKYSRSFFFFKLSQLHFCDRQYVCIFVCIKKFIKCRYFAFGALLSTEFYALRVKFLFLHTHRSFQ